MGISRKIFRDLISPLITFDDEGDKIMASYLRIILIVSISIIPIYVAFKLIQSDGLYPADYVLAGLVFFFLLLLFLIRRGKIVISGILFLLSGWVALTIMAAYADGVKDIAVVGYLIVIFLAILLTGTRFAVLVTAMSIASVWIMGIVHTRNGFMPLGDEPLNYSRDYTVLFILILAAISLFSRSYRHSFERINSELSERRKAEGKLTSNELMLKEKNEELNERNLQMIKINEELLRAKEKAEESDRLKTAFIQNISHEIRTPMNGIVGFLELLHKPDTNEEQKDEYISIVNSCTQQLASLVNDLIDIAKIEAGTIDMKLSDFNVDQLLAEVENSFSVAAAEKGLKLDIDNFLKRVRVRSDFGKIRQILFNLVSNAIKFTEHGTVTIRAMKDENNLVFSVTDTGIGIRESDHNIIFERFRQSEIGLNRTYGGSGLGLAISKGYIDFMGGMIRLESMAGKGSKFTVLIPVKFASAQADKVAEPSRLEFSKRIRILIAEDDDISYLYLRELFRGSNCEVIRAKNGADAVVLFTRSDKIDIVLMDLKMPVLNGYDAMHSIKSINPFVPVVAITAFELQEDLIKASGTQFDEYIVKPITKNELLSKIVRVLS
jgi:signal transduction histidine kinase